MTNAVNYASLVLGAETSGLLKGKKALEETTRAGANTDKAISGLDGRFKKTGDSAGAAAPKVERFSQATDATRSVALMATRALTGMAAGYASFAAAGAAINMARGFNAALAETSTLIEGTPEQLDALTEASRSMAREFGGSATDQVKAFYQAISAGADGVEGATQLLDQANKLAIGGITDVTTGVDALTTAMNAYGPDVLSAAEASDAMFVAMRAGKTTIGELSGSLGQIVPIASSAGVSFDEVTAGIAALTTQGLSTASATTGLRQVLASVIAPTKQATDAATALGVSFDVQALKSKGLAEFLDDVITKTGGNEAAMAQLFGSVEALGAALAFAGGAGGTFTDILADMEVKAGATDAAYLKMSESLDQRWNKLAAAATDIALGFGNALLAVVVPAMEGIAAASVAVGQNLDLVLVSLSALAATQIPAAVAGLVTLTAGMSASAVATGVFTTAVNIARGAVIALGGPLGVVWGILGAGAAAWAVWGKGAGEGETAAYDAAAGTSALLGQLDEFYKTTAPNAAAKAIDMANANYKLAASAFEAAKGELAKRRAMLDMAASSGANGTSGSIRDMGSSATYEAPKYQAALAKMEAAESALEQAMRDRKVTANAVTGSVSEVMSATVAASQSTNDHSVTLDINSGSLGKNAKAAGGASKALKDSAKSAKDMADEIERLEFDADPLKKYNAELADLDKLVAAGLSDGAYRKAVDELNDSLASGIPMVDDLANAFGDWAASGLTDFKSFTKSILSSFTGMISQMIATAARNRILIGLGFSGGGVAGAAAAGTPGGGVLGSLTGGGGILGSLSGSGGILGSIASKGIFGASGIFGSIGSSLGTSLGGILGGSGSALATSLGGIGASIGAIVPVLGIAAAAFSFFRTKTKELDSGLRITTTGMESLIQSFSTVEKKKFWGLSKKVRTSFSDLDEAAAAPLERIITDLQMGVVGATKALGIGASVFDDFTSLITVSTKGMSDADAQKAVEEALQGFGDDFAGMVPGLEALQQEGEGAYDALTRLSTSLGAANAVLDTLGAALYEISLSGAAAASSLVLAFGGLEAFNAATTAYYAGFYTEQERIETATQLVTEALADLGQVLPETRAQFRAIVEAQDLSTESGRKMFASLVGLAGQLDLVLPAMDSLADKLGALTSAAVDAALGPINDQITASNSAATQARQSADEFFRLADSLRGAADGIGGVSNAADAAAAGRSFAAQFRAAISGDVAALGGLGAAGTSAAQNGARFASTQEDARFLEAQIATQLNQAASVAEALGLGADYQAMLFDVQTAALEVIRDGLAQGNITQDILREQIGLLENIGQQIADGANLQVVSGRDETGRVVAGLVDNGGRVVAGLSDHGALYISAVGAASVRTADLVNAVLRSSAGVTVDAIVQSLAGVASDEVLARVIASVDQNRDGLVSQMEIDASRLSQGLNQLGSGLSIDIFRALDGNADSIISAEEISRAALIAANSAASNAISASVAQSGTVTANTLRSSLAGKASDDVLRAVILAVDANGDGLITAQETAAAQTVSGISSASLSQIQSDVAAATRVSNAIAQQSNLISSLTAQQIAAVDANGDGIVSAQEAQTASIVSAYQSTVAALASAIDRNGAMTTAQIRTSLAGKASDAAISAVISAVDRNKDGIVSAEEIAAARTLSGLSSNTAAQLQALTQQSLVFGNAITGQTGSITGTQGLTNDELGKVQDLQGQTVSITELVKRAVAGSETLNEALLNRLSDGITVAGVPSMVSGLNNISNLMARIVSAQEAALAAAEAEANRQQALTKAQAQLESTFTAQQAAIGEVSSASAAIYGLASQFGVYVNAKSGAVDLSQSAKFGVSDQGLFEAQYGQISSTGGSNVSGFKNTFYQDGGLYSQTYGRAGELRNLAADLAARRQAIIDLGGIPSYSVGTDFHPGGLAYVHKDEMINLPRGSSVSTTSQTSKMLDNSAVVEELRALREEVARLRSENNQGHQNTGSEVARGTKPLREVTATGSLPVKVIS
jgi:TP901 family phage tail tape measure protein